jgi:hypothetical protein
MAVKIVGFSLPVLQFLSALLPGGVVLFGLVFVLGALGVSVPILLPEGTVKWIVYGIASLLVGYLLQVPARWLDPVYDRTYARMRRRNGDPLLDYAKREAEPYIGKHGSVYGWARGKVHVEDPRLIADVDFIEGISKLFRTLSFSAFISALLGLMTGRSIAALTFLIFAILSFFVFSERRFAATGTLYQYVRHLRERPPTASRITSA